MQTCRPIGPARCRGGRRTTYRGCWKDLCQSCAGAQLCSGAPLAGGSEFLAPGTRFSTRLNHGFKSWGYHTPCLSLPPFSLPGSGSIPLALPYGRLGFVLGGARGWLRRCYKTAGLESKLHGNCWDSWVLTRGAFLAVSIHLAGSGFSSPALHLHFETLWGDGVLQTQREGTRCARSRRNP